MDDLFDLEPGDLSEREERCQKAMKTVAKAIFMRLVVTGLLIWVILSTVRELWVVGLMLLVLVINVTGILPLAAELKKRRAEWKLLLEEEE
jgi:uncharacterized membrane protein HdeD (DUF308 family)